MSQVELTEDQRKGLADNKGCVQGNGYILISAEVYRQTMGVASNEEFAESLKAIQEGQNDVQAGRTRPFRDVLASLGK